MADKKVTQLTDLGNALASVDLFHVIDDPAGTPINKKITAEDVFNNIPTWLGVAQTSQALTADGAADGWRHEAGRAESHQSRPGSCRSGCPERYHAGPGTS